MKYLGGVNWCVSGPLLWSHRKIKGYVYKGAMSRRWNFKF